MENATEEVILAEGKGAELDQKKMNIPFAIAGDMMSDKVLEKLFNAPKLDFNTNASTWSPEAKGERKRLVFQGIKEKSKTKNIFRKDNDDEPEYVYLDKAVFVEVFQDDEKIKQRMIESYAVSLISYMVDNHVPRHAIMDVEYLGKERATSGFNYDTFSVNLVPLEF